MVCSKQGNATKGARFNNAPAPDMKLWEAANRHVPSMRYEQLVRRVVGHLTENEAKKGLNAERLNKELRSLFRFGCLHLPRCC